MELMKLLLTPLLFCYFAFTAFTQSILPSNASERFFLREKMLQSITPASSEKFFGLESLGASESSSEEKSNFLAVVYSLILPGMGEFYAGNLSRGKYPLMTEGVLWLGYAGLNLYGGWTREDARTFAFEHSSLNPTGKDDDFYVNVGNYMSVHEYNQKKLKDRELDKVYAIDPAAGYLWSWDTETNREKYKDARILSEELINNSRFVILALIANRVWSAIQASGLVNAYNRSQQSSARFVPDFHSQIQMRHGRVDGVTLELQTKF